VEKNLAPLVYLVAIVLFVLGIKRLGKVRTARGGNALAALAMLLAIVATLYGTKVVDYRWLIGGIVVGALIGLVAAIRVEMTQMPEMVALFNGSGGAASLLVALAILVPSLSPDVWVAGKTLASVPLASVHPEVTGTALTALLAKFSGADIGLSLMLSIIIGGVTLTGSFVAYGKLSGKITGNAVVYPGQHAVNATLILITFGITGYMLFGLTESGPALPLALAVTGLALLLGVLLVLPIGGADMPVVISLLNSYSGIAAAMTGFVLQENVLIVSGAMVGAAGLILTNIMCKAMNRSLLSVLLGGFGATTAVVDKAGARDYKSIKSIGAEELAMLLDGISSVIFVPGYGLAVAQAQHVVRELADMLEKAGVEVRYAIHPVAGRMPGHMNVLLAESNVPYEQLIEMDEINGDFKTTDLVIVLGANDVVNPVAIDPNEPNSPLAGMPILNAHEAASVVVIKRSLSPGYAGVKNLLFDMDNTHMCFGDAKKVLQETVNELKDVA
jgi:NAD(P) transhydrogenase subunit beta